MAILAILAIDLPADLQLELEHDVFAVAGVAAYGGVQAHGGGVVAIGENPCLGTAEGAGGVEDKAQQAALDFAFRREQLYFEILLDVRDALERR